MAATFFVRKEPLAPLAAVAPDAPAGIGSFGAVTHEHGLFQDDGKDRHGAVGGDGGGPSVPGPWPHEPGDFILWVADEYRQRYGADAIGPAWIRLPSPST